MYCKICGNAFGGQEDIIYLCEHKKGFVHCCCCVNQCSWNKSPCKHKIASFMNIDRVKPFK